MSRPRRARIESSVDLTPLIDVVFLLLLFFMVSTTFIRETQLKIELPEASGELQELEGDLVEITVNQRGGYAVNGHALADGELRTLIRALEDLVTDRGKAPRLVVTADAKASHQAVVRAMDAAGKVGLNKISITTRQPSDEE